MITNQPIRRLFSRAAATLALTERRAAIMLLMMVLTTTAWATDVTLSGSDNYTAQDGDLLTGTTSGTITIDNNASITLSDATITAGIICEGSATITLVGTNIVSNTWYSSAGIQIGSSGTTLTIKGNGTLTATGGSAAAGIGLGRTWNASVTAGSIVIDGGTVTASGDIGIGIGTVGHHQTAAIDGISIKGGTVNASLGKGTINYGSTATVGYIKIYDTIEMVDASKITETVTYMHDDDDVTANKTDYFTIGEDGDRRIIVPKDDTDYTITIADGIEHGTLEGAATAKYMEKVTITATPALGYRFSRLVVKDAQNNDVASTDNSFFMPKSNVTVSAVFEQATHGTTEFAWGYIESGVFVTEATIYDGVTTVNLQQGKKYFIGKDYQESPEPGMGYYENTFRLDEDPYTEGRNIPYSGGTGSFMMSGYSKFRLNGDAGYYDITMTDVGNGKWNVSILKTAGQMDVVPDQTYTGSAITPEPTVIAGSLNLTKGTDYVYSYENNENVGTAKVIAIFQGTYAWLGYVEKEFTIVKATPTVNAPTAVENLIHNGSAQALVNAGSTDFGTLLYSLDGETYSEDIPTATSAGTHTVYYKVAGDNNHNDVFGSLDVTIAPKAVTNDGITIAAIADHTYTGSAIEPEVTVTDGETTLTLGTDYTVEYSDNTNVGTATVTVTGIGNYGGTIERTFTINPKTVPVPTAVIGLIYTGSEQTGVACGDGYTVTGGTATATGNHTATATLNDASNYQWSDQTTEPQEIAWSIAYYAASLADDADNAAELTNIIGNYGGKADVTLQGRTLFKDGDWNTLCLPFALSAEEIAAHEDFSGATLMELDTDGKNGFDPTDGTLWLTFKSATAIAAGVPYLVKWDAAGDDFTSPVFSGVTIDATASTTVSDADDELQEVQMVGCYSPVPVVADDKSILFLGDANTLYYSSIDRDIRSCRAYFSVPYIKQNASAKARAFRLDFGDGEQTGIMTVQGEGFAVNGADAWYTLDGRKLDAKPTTKGLYINGGKKVVIK